MSTHLCGRLYRREISYDYIDKVLKRYPKPSDFIKKLGNFPVIRVYSTRYGLLQAVGNKTGELKDFKYALASSEDYYLKNNILYYANNSTSYIQFNL